ncbi:Molybdenum+cofactor+guanylyltransferase [Methylocapsa aurea]|jgi:molybdopterin-guanine dinucleotide biosynthesis protein A|uniref:molybdenum cofactor guanylyltransferase MobA n=1 Tax=Methylocapsa aurea TaxID=663610 RepID=UPI003D18AB51
MRCFGLILAGGQALRMGGVAKPLIQVGGAPILEHVVRRLAPQCVRLALNANGDPERYAAFHLPIVPDQVEGFAGPLAGVLAGLDHVAAHFPDVPLVLSVPADTPFIPQDLVQRLASARVEAKAEIAVAKSGDRVHHAVALWPVALREELRHALVKEDLRKVSGFIERYASTLVEWPDAPYDPFFNVNRPEDVELAERIAASLEAQRS